MAKQSLKKNHATNVQHIKFLYKYTIITYLLPGLIQTYFSVSPSYYFLTITSLISLAVTSYLHYASKARFNSEGKLIGLGLELDKVNALVYDVIYIGWCINVLSIFFGNWLGWGYLFIPVFGVWKALFISLLSPRQRTGKIQIMTFIASDLILPCLLGPIMYCHYILIKYKPFNLSLLTYGIFVYLLSAVLHLCFPITNLTLMAFFQITPMINMLRYLDFWLLDNESIQWTLEKYMIFYLSSVVTDDKKKRKDKIDVDVFGFYASLFVEYVFFNLGHVYIRKFGFPAVESWTVPIGYLFTTAGLKVWIAHYFFGIISCLQLDLMISLFHFPIHLYYGIEFKPVMNRPWLSKSVRNFWSDRWNMLVKDNLHRLSFQPTYNYFVPVEISSTATSTTPIRKNTSKRPATRSSTKKITEYSLLYLLVAKCIAAMSAFIFSGIFHEILLYQIGLKSDLENLAFFFLHGVASIVDVFLCRMILGNPMRDGWSVGCVARVIGTSLFFVWTSPMFLIPFIRDGFMWKIGLPLIF